MKLTKARLKEIIKEELAQTSFQEAGQLDPFVPIQDDFEALLDKHNVQDPLRVLDELRDRWETMLADRRWRWRPIGRRRRKRLLRSKEK